MADIHFITGAKGGIGKTICSLCASLYYALNRTKVIIVDLNYHNTDLSDILLPCSTETILPLGDTGFKIKKIINQAHLIYPDPAGDVAGHLPWYGAIGIFQYLNSIFEYLEEKSFRVQKCIVDTGLHLSNLNIDYSGVKFTDPKKGKAITNGIEYVNIKLKSLLKHNLKLWFIWTLAIFKKLYEYDLVVNALSNLAKVKWVKGFNETSNLIHLINPYGFSPEIKIFNFKIDEEERIDGLISIAETTNRIVNISLSQFHDSIYSALNLYTGDNQEKYFEEIARSIGLPSLPTSHPSNKKKESWQRHNNVFIIPYFKRSLTGFTDKYGLKTNISINMLTNELGSILTKITDYLNVLQ